MKMTNLILMLSGLTLGLTPVYGLEPLNNNTPANPSAVAVTVPPTPVTSVNTTGTSNAATAKASPVNQVIFDFSKKVVTSANTYDYKNYSSNLRKASHLFTPAAWTSFEKALKASRNLEAIKKQRLTLNSTISGDVTLVSKNWQVVIPLKIDAPINASVKTETSASASVSKKDKQAKAAPKLFDAMLTITEQDKTSGAHPYVISQFFIAPHSAKNIGKKKSSDTKAGTMPQISSNPNQAVIDFAKATVAKSLEYAYNQDKNQLQTISEQYTMDGWTQFLKLDQLVSNEKLILSAEPIIKSASFDVDVPFELVITQQDTPVATQRQIVHLNISTSADVIAHEHLSVTNYTAETQQ